MPAPSTSPIPVGPGAPPATPTGRTRATALPLAPAGLLLAALLAAPPPASAQDWCDDVDSRQHCEVREMEVAIPDGRLSVEAGANGGIRVEVWDGDGVRAEARVTARARDRERAEEVAREVETRTEAGRLWADGPGQRGQWGRDEGWSVSYRVRVPAGTALDLRATNGGIRVDGVEGEVRARTTNGGIELSDVAGPVSVRGTNGGIRVSLLRLPDGDGTVDVRTTNGPVTLVLPRDAGARLEARTTNGRITTDFPITVQGRIGRQLSGTLGDGGPEVRVVTTNGPVEIRER